jgi:hypothetical protein
MKVPIGVENHTLRSIDVLSYINYWVPLCTVFSTGDDSPLSAKRQRYIGTGLVIVSFSSSGYCRQIASLRAYSCEIINPAWLGYLFNNECLYSININ